MASNDFKQKPVIKQGLIFHYVPTANLNFGKWKEQMFVLHEGGYLAWYKDPRSFEKGFEEGYIVMPRVSTVVCVDQKL